MAGAPTATCGDGRATTGARTTGGAATGGAGLASLAAGAGGGGAACATMGSIAADTCPSARKIVTA